RFAERGGTLHLQGGGDARVAVAASALEEQLGRLVENVLVHHHGTPHARISVARAGGRARFEVADDGPGLHPEERERVLELFRRAGPRRPDDERAGAGLAIVKRATEAWGGTLALDACPEGGLLARVE